MPILNGYKEIGDYMRRSERGARRLVREGLPVTFLNGRATTTTEAIDRWIDGRLRACPAPPDPDGPRNRP